LDEQLWEVKAAQVWQVQEGAWSQRTYGLVWARNPATGEEKYFLSNAPVVVAVATLLRVAFCRWHVEHGFRVVKSEIGFSHYEGRNYRGLMRHQTLCLLMLSFVAEPTERLRGEKWGGDVGAGVQRLEPAVPGVAGGSTRHQPPPSSSGDPRLSPTAEWCGPPVASEASPPAQKAA
jgi:SRSO17 transposase